MQEQNICKYIVDKENRKVVCVIENTRLNFIDFAQDNLRFEPDCDFEYRFRRGIGSRNGFVSKLQMPNRFVGIAICGPNDEWNEETGRRIAYSRAKLKLDTSFFKRARTYINTIDDWLEDSIVTINRYGDKLSHNAEHREKNINYLLGVDNGNKDNN